MSEQPFSSRAATALSANVSPQRWPPDYPVIVAGQHLEQAKAASVAIGHGVRSRLIDVTVEASIAAALEGVSTVVSCIEQPQRRSCARLVQPGTVLTTLRPTNRGRTFPGK